MCKRFWDKVNKTDSCWLWTRCVNESGYGVFCNSGKTILAHRYSYQICKGDIPEGLLICHTCDVRECVNPQHLYAGTHIQNMKDMVDRGRQGGNKKGNKGQNKGEKCGAAKLKDSDIQNIRDLYNDFTCLEISRKYNVCSETIRSIISKKTWAHI